MPVCQGTLQGSIKLTVTFHKIPDFLRLCGCPVLPGEVGRICLHTWTPWPNLKPCVSLCVLSLTWAMVTQSGRQRGKFLREGGREKLQTGLVLGEAWGACTIGTETPYFSPWSHDICMRYETSWAGDTGPASLSSSKTSKQLRSKLSQIMCTSSWAK